MAISRSTSKVATSWTVHSSSPMQRIAVLLKTYYVILFSNLVPKILGKDESLSEKHAMFILIADNIYFHATKEFPNDNALRISYAFFLLENMHSKQRALQELNQAEQTKPTFDEQFIIYRYKKLIEDEVAETKTENQGGLDLISETAFQNQFKVVQANIEKAALLHMEFWSQLSEESPDLGKMNDIGSKINSSVQFVEDSWIKLNKIYPNNTKAMQAYGRFFG